MRSHGRPPQHHRHRFSVHKNLNLNFPSYHSLTISNFRLHPCGPLSWDRMRVSYHNQIGFVRFQQLTPRRNPKKNRQLQRIGFVWSNRNCGTALLACPSCHAWPRRRPPAAPPPSHLRNWLRFVKRLPATFPTQRRIASYRELASFGQIATVGQASWPVHPGRLAARRPPTAPPPSHLRNWLRFVKRLPVTFPTQRRIASYRGLASFRQISASGTALMPCPARA